MVGVVGVVWQRRSCTKYEFVDSSLSEEGEVSRPQLIGWWTGLREFF
jgi:hypothetical protein